MTPERKAWWDSLPAEAKRVRMDIELCKKQIKWQKRNLRWVVLTGDECKMIINHNKRVIKALHKQIAMRPVIKKSLKCLGIAQLAIAYLMCQGQVPIVIDAARN